ncbi:hypothetical protein APA386B_501 [Acetobacter pasteurianus 386B]|nr:hypothetical protein APA386B_501 [Acetobacter pasteurianus 386B]
MKKYNYTSSLCVIYKSFMAILNHLKPMFRRIINKIAHLHLPLIGIP